MMVVGMMTMVKRRWNWIKRIEYLSCSKNEILECRNLDLNLALKLGGLQQKNRWIVGLNNEPTKIYHTHSHVQEMKKENRYDPVPFVMIDVVEREE